MHQGIANGGISMGVKLHGVPYDIGYFVEAAVVDPLHGMHDTALHWFQSVNNIWNGTLKDHIGGIIDEIVLIHSCEAGDFYILMGMVIFSLCVQ